MGLPKVDWDSVRYFLSTLTRKESRSPQFPLSDGDLAKFFAVALDGLYLPGQNFCLALCMNFFLGLRIGELSALQFSDFDFSKGLLRIRRTDTKYFSRDGDDKRSGSMVYVTTHDLKTANARREIPISPQAAYFFGLIKDRHLRKCYKSDFLCYEGMDTVRIRALDRVLRKMCALAGIPQFNSHLIRKTFASRLHDGGMSSKSVGALLGHADISTTERAYILARSDKADEYRRSISNLYSGIVLPGRESAFSCAPDGG